MAVEFSYLQILNIFLQEYGVKIQQDVTRIDSLLRRACSEVKSQCRKIRGRSQGDFLRKFRKIVVHKNEIVRVVQVEEELQLAQKKLESLLEGKEQLQNRCEKLYQDLRNALNREKEIELKLDSKEADHDQLLSKNKELKAYIDKLSGVDELKNNGKGILEVGERQQRRKLKELKTSVERTLWFAETYGLSLNSASFSDQKGSNYTLCYCTGQEKKSFKDLPDEDQDKIKEVLFIQDRFSIGEAVYHELKMTQSGEGLPRTYLIKQCKESLNELCHIERTPGKAEGAQLNFIDELHTTIKKHVSFIFYAAFYSVIISLNLKN